MNSLPVSRSTSVGLAYRPVTEVDRVVRTVCSPNCMGTCGVNAHVKDDLIVRLEPADFPDAAYKRICLKGIAMATQRLHHPDRLTHPMIRNGPRGSGQWRKISWEEANAYIAERLTKVRDEYGARANAWINAIGNYGFKAYTSTARMANSMQGSYFTSLMLSGDFGGSIGLISTLGVFVASNDISEIGGAKYLLNVGRNCADTAHSEMHFIFDAQEQGLKHVVVDPRFTRTAAKSDEWVAPHPGSDIAFALGLIHVIVRDNLIDLPYVLRHTNAPFLVRRDTRALLRERDLRPGGSEAFMVWDAVSGAPTPVSEASELTLRGVWQLTAADGTALECCTSFEANWAVWQRYTAVYAQSLTGVPAEQIERVAREYATSPAAWIWLGMGPQRYYHGHLTYRAYVTLAALCGNIGKPYAGVNYMEGASFAMGIAPPPEWMSPGGKTGSTLPGTRLLEIIRDGQPYPVKSLWTAAIGFGSQTPFFKRFVEEALPQLELFAVSELVMTEAAQWADIVLPCVSYFEDDWDLVGGGENWIMQLRRRAVPPVGESRNDIEIYSGVARLMGEGEHWQIDPEQSCKELLAKNLDPRIASVDWETLKRDGVARVEVPRPYTPFRDMQFRTASGRIELYQEMFVDVGEETLDHKEPLETVREDSTYRLRLLSVKTVHSAHAQHTILPAIKEVMGDPRLEIATADALPRGIADGDWVTVFNERGRVTLQASVADHMRPGVMCITQGFWRRHFRDGHPQDLIGRVPDNPVQTRMMETNNPLLDVLCDVKRASQVT